MKNFLIIFSTLISAALAGQTYKSFNIDLVGLIHPNTSTVGANVGNKYAGCWGWYQASKNKEYAISGASTGTYFVDITNPATPSVCAFVPGTVCTWREMKTYGQYCYVVSDYCQPNNFQIIDMQYLPDSVHVVHKGTNHFELGHTIFIDKDKMYVGLTGFAGPGNRSAMTVWSLATPTAPVLLRRIEQDTLSVGKIAEVHDMYVRNDTVYASAGWQGLRIMKLTAANTFTSIGTYDGYPSEGYNHSSWLTQNGRYLLFCDEVPSSLPMHLIDLQNPANIQPVKYWRPYPLTTPHNPYIMGNKHAVVSCYQDGLIIYDISKPPAVALAGYFDTYPQGGENTGNYGGSAYNGNWGAYPYLPSGIIIANDMQNGIFLLNANKALQNSVGLQENAMAPGELFFYPNPADDIVNISFRGKGNPRVVVTNLLGQTVDSFQTENSSDRQLQVSGLAPGTYIVSLESEEGTVHKKLVIAHK